MAVPTISLLLGNYNDAAYVGGALTQLLEQTVPACEVIVLDDGSTDNSLEVIDAIAAQHPRLKVLRFGQNQGICAGYGRMLAEAQGDFVFLFAADDHIAPTMVERCTAILAEHPEVGICTWEPAGLVSQGGPVLPEPRGWSAVAAGYPPAQVPDLLRLNARLGGITVLYSRQGFLECGGYRAELRWFSDWFAATVLALRHGLCYVPEPLTAFFIRATGFSQRGHRDWEGQRAVVGALVGLLDSPQFADVREPLRALGLMRVIGWRGLCILLGRRGYWPWVTPGLVRGVLVDCVLHFKAAVFPYLPRSAVGLWRTLARLWRRPAAPVASESGDQESAQ